MRKTYIALGLVIGLISGIVGEQVLHKRMDSRQSELHARVLLWVEERNQNATLRDFKDFPDVLLQMSSTAGIDYRLTLAIIDKESQFDPRAVGKAGEVGLMQIMPGTAEPYAKALGLTFEPPVRAKAGGYASLGTLADPRLNVRIGLAILAEARDKFGSMPVALRAYNRGDSKAAQHWPSDRYAEDVSMRVVSLLPKFPR